MVSQPHVFFLDSQGQQPVFAVILPIVEPFQVRIRLTEKLQLHLFEFPGAEGEVSRSNLIAEGFSDLADAERKLSSGSALDIGKVYEDALAVSGRRKISFFASSVTP